MTKISFILFVSVVFAALSSNTAAAQLTGTLEGTVSDFKTGDKLPGVNIMLVGTVLGTATDMNGRFHLSKIPPGIYHIRVSMMGYERIDQTDATVKSGQTLTVDFQMSETIIESTELLVTANKRRQSLEDSPNSVGIMTSRQFKQRNEIDLDKLLKYASGVNFVDTQVNIRGSSGYSYGAGSRVLFLIDGVPVMPGDSGDIKWDLIPATQIDHVEIIKGAGSALYGGSALGGVINVITKSASPKPTTNIRLSAGVYDNPAYAEWDWTDRILHFDNVNVDHTRKMGNSDILLAFGRQQSTGFQQAGHYKRWNGSAKVHTTLGGQHNITLSTNFELGSRGAALMWRSQRRALEVAPAATGDYVDSDKFSLNVFHNWIVSKNFGLKTRLSYFRNYWKNYFHDNITGSTADRLGAEIQGDLQLSPYNSLVFGMEEAWDHVVSDLVGKHDQYVISGYIQNERALLTNLMLTLGMRYDFQHVDIGFDDSELNPKVGLVWHTLTTLSLRASSGRGFRSASMSERFADSIYSGLRIIPNERLKSETAWSHELGLNFRPHPLFYLDAALFRSDYWNLIEPEPDENQIVQFKNITRACIRGAEFSLKFVPWTKSVTVDLGYTYMDPRDLELNTVLAYRSHHIFTGSLTYSIGPFELGADVHYVSEPLRFKVYPQEDRIAQKLLNGRLAYRLGHWTISGNANNIFNHNHTQRERILMPIRNYVLTVTSMF